MGVVRKYRPHGAEGTSHVVGEACSYHQGKGIPLECAKVRIYPVDDYEEEIKGLRDRIKSVAKDFCILKVPLLGQNNIDRDLLGWKSEWESFKTQGVKGYKDVDDWCGRTSASMLYNWFQLISGSDPAQRYVTHWDGGNHGSGPCDQTPGWYRDLRWGEQAPEGYHSTDRAMHLHPKEEVEARNRWQRGDYDTGIYPGFFPAGTNKGTYESTRIIESETPVLYEEVSSDPNDPSVEKIKVAYRSSTQREMILALKKGEKEDRFRQIRASISAGNPVLTYTGISKSKWGNHIVLIVGWMQLTPPGHETTDLWLVFADPAGADAIKALFGPAQEKEEKGDEVLLDVADIAWLKPQHKILRILYHSDDWNNRQAALYAIKATALLETHPYETEKNRKRYGPARGLFLCDDRRNRDALGMVYKYCTTVQDIPPEAVIRYELPPLSLPMSSPGEPGSPAEYYYVNELQRTGGYYPLGGFQNLHSGIHLDPIETDARQKYTAVRAIAPGHLVALRMFNAYPESVIDESGENAECVDSGAEAAQEISGNSNAMALVRHQFGVAGTEEVLTLHFLYLHLLEPSWEEGGGPHAAIAWLNELARRRYGSLTLLTDATVGAPAASGEGEEAGAKKATRASGDAVSAGEHLWLARAPDPPDQVPPLDQIEVFPRSFLDPKPLSLPEGSRAEHLVLKPPPVDHTTTITAIRQGKLITFRSPERDVLLNAGDTIGYVAAESPLGSAFFHFEIVEGVGSSGGGALARLEALAKEKLKIDPGVFRLYTEKEEGKKNYFEDAAELDNLFYRAGILTADGDSQGRARYLGDPQGSEYNPEHLRRLMASERSEGEEKLPFAVDHLGLESPGDLEYATILHLENPGEALKPGRIYKVTYRFHAAKPRPKRVEAPEEALEAEECDASGITSDLGIPDRSFDLCFAEDGAPFEVPILVPAAARYVELESDDCDLSVGAYLATPEQDTAHFSRLVPTRFRNLRILHHNEWTYQGMIDSLKSRFGEGEAVESFAEALAWWQCAELGIEHPAGDNKSLFDPAGLSAKPPALPSEDEAKKAEQMHPITAWWILAMLVKHGHLEPLYPKPHQEEETEEPPEVAPMVAALLPAMDKHPVYRVGDALHAIVVHDGPADLEPEEGLAFRMGFGGAEAYFPAKFTMDAAKAKVSLSAWGSLSFEVDYREQTVFPRWVGATSLSVMTPVASAGPLVAPPKGEGTSFAWSLDFASGCPKSLEGYVTLHYATTTGPASLNDLSLFAESAVAVRVVATDAGSGTASLVNTRLLLIKDGWVTSSLEPTDETYVSGSGKKGGFTWKEYCDAAAEKKDGRPAHLALALMEGLQHLRIAVGKSKDSKGLDPADLSADGLTITVHSSSKYLIIEAKKLQAAGVFSALEELSATGAATQSVRLSVPEPPAPGEEDTSGTLSFQLELGEALEALLSTPSLSTFLGSRADEEPEYLHVLLGYRFYNGGFALPAAIAEAQVEAGNADPSFVYPSYADLERESGAAPIEALAQHASLMLTVPHISALHAAQSSGASYVITGTLHGAKAEVWKRLGLKLRIEDENGAVSEKDVTIASVKSAIGGATGSFSYTLRQRDYPDTTLRITAVPKKNNLLYGPELFTVAETAAIELNTRTHVESVEVLLPEVTSASGEILIRGQTYGVPSGRSLLAWITSEDDPAEGLDSRFGALPIRYTMPDKKSGPSSKTLPVPQGFVGSDGKLEARLDPAALYSAVSAAGLWGFDGATLRLSLGGGGQDPEAAPIEAATTTFVLPLGVDDEADGEECEP